MQFALLTISDSRTKASDQSGQLIKQLLQEAGLTCLAYQVVSDDVVEIQSAYLALERQNPALIITNGGTGIAQKDVTLPALQPLLITPIPGIGEAFRTLSYQAVGPRALASRASAGFNYRQQLTYCLPGSPNAVELAVKELILPTYQHLLFERSNARKELHDHVNATHSH